MGFPGKNTGVGCQALVQGICPTQGSNPHLFSPALASRFLPLAPPGNSESTNTQFLVIGKGQEADSPLELPEGMPPC